ncbi:alpha/beta fold hydrolase [Nocardiopsis sp. N85]|uniref:alpha/beta fold hydrolase n=1 Tax=Nocardiopsis sp. N85 TaxID=3029400 RepID=UPI00237F303B|nr:alpha/beta fold hydrolase [Nocardiopsis sp. N85]MDE3720796.1 alpha/beta fold hydrolase [Nocardiopsis sp. N85]
MTRLVPPGAEVGFIEVDGGRVRALTAGEPTAPPIVLIHGGGTDNAAISWYRLIEPLGRTHRVIAVDLPGFGGTTGIPPVGGPWEQADLVARTMAAIGVEGAVVFGVSMGGDVALRLALRHPGVVDGLVLIAPGGLVPILRDRFAHGTAWLTTRLPERLLVALGGFTGRFTRPLVRAVVHDIATLPEPVVEEFAREAIAPGASLAFVRYNLATIGRRTMLNYAMDEVASITAPTLFFHGEKDPMVPIDGSRRAAALMPDARVVSVPECGHWAQLEAHDRFLSEVIRFLDGIRR